MVLYGVLWSVIKRAPQSAPYRALQSLRINDRVPCKVLSSLMVARRVSQSFIILCRAFQSLELHNHFQSPIMPCKPCRALQPHIIPHKALQSLAVPANPLKALQSPPIEPYSPFLRLTEPYNPLIGALQSLIILHRALQSLTVPYSHPYRASQNLLVPYRP